MSKVGCLALDAIRIAVGFSFFAVFSLCVVFAIPDNFFTGNTQKSLDIIGAEGLVARTSPSICSTQVDNYTNAIMLNIASHTTSNCFDAALSSYMYGEESYHSVDPIDALANSVNKHIEDFDSFNGNSYGRYWHGYLVVLKPLLMLFDISTIRLVLAALSLSMIFYLSYWLACRFSFRYGLLFALSFVPFHLASCFMSLSLSISLMVSLICSCIVISSRSKDNLIMRNPSTMFFFFGILIAFFDFLCTPVLSLAFPMLFHFMDNRKNLNCKTIIKLFVVMSISWCIGYFVFWSLKWILASIFTSSNVIFDAVEQIGVRSSATGGIGDSATSISRLDGVAANVRLAFSKKSLLIYLFIVLLAFVARFRSGFRSSNRLMVSLLAYILVSILPLFWFIVVSNHSFIHSWFTYRGLIVVVACMFLFIADILNQDFSE